MQYPFEFAKTRTQLQGTKSGNPFAVIAQVVRQDGVGSLYTGCSTLILVSIRLDSPNDEANSVQGTTFKAGVRFLSFDYIKNMLMDDAGRLSPARGIVAGMIAGAFESVIAVTPTERVKTAL